MASSVFSRIALGIPSSGQDLTIPLSYPVQVHCAGAHVTGGRMVCVAGSGARPDVGLPTRCVGASFHVGRWAFRRGMEDRTELRVREGVDAG